MKCSNCEGTEQLRNVIDCNGEEKEWIRKSA